MLTCSLLAALVNSVELTLEKSALAAEPRLALPLSPLPGCTKARDAQSKHSEPRPSTTSGPVIPDILDARPMAALRGEGGLVQQRSRNDCGLVKAVGASLVLANSGSQQSTSGKATGQGTYYILAFSQTFLAVY